MHVYSSSSTQLQLARDHIAFLSTRAGHFFDDQKPLHMRFRKDVCRSWRIRGPLLSTPGVESGVGQDQRNFPPDSVVNLSECTQCKPAAVGRQGPWTVPSSTVLCREPRNCVSLYKKNSERMWISTWPTPWIDFPFSGGPHRETKSPNNPSSDKSGRASTRDKNAPGQMKLE